VDLIIIKLIRKILEPQNDYVNEERPGKMDFSSGVESFIL